MQWNIIINRYWFNLLMLCAINCDNFSFELFRLLNNERANVQLNQIKLCFLFSSISITKINCDNLLVVLIKEKTTARQLVKIQYVNSPTIGCSSLAHFFNDFTNLI